MFDDRDDVDEQVYVVKSGNQKFILRSQVLQLYRQMLRIVKEITDESHKKELTKWIQDDFKRNKHLTDEDAIKMMVMKGRMSLREIEQAIHLAR